MRWLDGGGREGEPHAAAAANSNPAGVLMSAATQQRPLAHVKRFDKTEPPVQVQTQPIEAVADHVPRPVPAQRVTLGYQPASQPGPVSELGGVAAGFVSQTPPLSSGPVFYSPPTRYPSVDDIATERQQFWSRPETPALARDRRIGELREAALQLRSPDGMYAQPRVVEDFTGRVV